MVISRVFPCKILHIHITSVSGCLSFTFKKFQTVEGTSMIRQFHNFFKSHFWRDFAIRLNCAPPPPPATQDAQLLSTVLWQSHGLYSGERRAPRGAVRWQSDQTAASAPLHCLALRTVIRTANLRQINGPHQKIPIGKKLSIFGQDVPFQSQNQSFLTLPP